MVKKIAVIDYSKCNPERCENGECRAVVACKAKVLKQYDRYLNPEPPMTCIGCGLCSQVCPVKAIYLV